MLLHSTHQMFPVIVTLLLLFLLPDLTTNEIRFAFHLRIEVSLILSRLSLSGKSSLSLVREVLLV